VRLVIGRIETQEIEIQNPHLERLMMVRKDSISGIYKVAGDGMELGRVERRGSKESRKDERK